jgi:hypothetical protein
MWVAAKIFILKDRSFRRATQRETNNHTMNGRDASRFVAPAKRSMCKADFYADGQKVTPQQPNLLSLRN